MGESVAELPQARDRATGEHLVCFTDRAGTSTRERYASLAAAVSRVEQLANDEGVQDTEVFALHPVRLARQQRWHVAVAPSAPEAEVALHAAVTAAIVDAVPDAAAHLDAVDVEVVEESFYAATPAAAPASEVGPGPSSDVLDDVLPPQPRGRGLGFFVH
jgi:hypothetical protein